MDGGEENKEDIYAKTLKLNGWFTWKSVAEKGDKRILEIIIFDHFWGSFRQTLRGKLVNPEISGNRDTNPEPIAISLMFIN